MLDCGPEPRAPDGSTDLEIANWINALVYWGRGCAGKLGALRQVYEGRGAPPDETGN